MSTPLGSRNPTQHRFFNAAEAAFRQAVQRIGLLERALSIAGRKVVLRFAGPSLEKLLLPPLAHHAPTFTDEPPSLTLLIWDTETTGIELPQSPWDLNRAPRRGAIIMPEADQYPAFVMTNAGLVSQLNIRQRVGFYWTRSPQELPAHECAAPFRPLLHIWLREHGMRLFHTAAVASQNKAVLLVGRGGAGKSSTALNCLTSGLDCLGDDFCIVEPDSPSPRVHSLYGSAKLDPAFINTIPGFPESGKTQHTQDNGKSVLFLNELFTDRVIPSAQVKAVLVPVVSKTPETRLVRTSPGEALQALAASTLLLLPGSRDDDLRAAATLVSRLPCYRIELGTRLETVSQAVAKAIGGNG